MGSHERRRSDHSWCAAFHYLDMDPEKVVQAVGKPCAIIDCFCILDDEKIEQYFRLGCEVKGMGRGHIQRIKEKVRKNL